MFYNLSNYSSYYLIMFSVTIEEKSMKLLEDKIANLELLVASLIHDDKIDNSISIPYPR